jgi:hypothetical protein
MSSGDQFEGPLPDAIARAATLGDEQHLQRRRPRALGLRSSLRPRLRGRTAGLKGISGVVPLPRRRG